MKLKSLTQARGHPCGWKKTVCLVAVATLCGPAAFHATSAESQSNVPLMEGGLRPQPAIVSVVSTNPGSLTIDWFHWPNLGGPWKLEKSSQLPGATWDQITVLTNGNLVELPMDEHAAYFRISGRSPDYVGAITCSFCHPGIHDEWSETRHAGALETLKQIHQDQNDSCAVCHTAGLGLPSGFVSEATTPHLAGVQCENCHGPAADHVLSPVTLTKRPQIPLAAEVCGGCHSDIHHPTYEEWSSSKHAHVVPEVASSLVSGGEARVRSCGTCHSGAARVAMLEAVEDNSELELPSGEEAAQVGITCVVCHDPHDKTPNGAQLRNPTASMEPFSYSTSTSTSFAEQYNPEINLCGQCHNDRGAAWTDTSRPPHHSPQYNILIGSAGVTDGFDAPQSYHRNIDRQCAHCHTHQHEPEAVTPESPNFMGHDFVPHSESCEPCHTPEGADLFKQFAQTGVKQRIAEVKDLLDEWATTRAPEALRTKYGTAAWEYTNEGELTNPDGDPNISGPSSAEQADIPDNIKQARYNLYLVVHDGSFGVHNADYCRFLLSIAKRKVNLELGASGSVAQNTLAR